MPLPDVQASTSYGGANLLDYGGIPPVDPTTDRGASQVNPLVADVAALSQLGCRSWAQLITAGGSAPSLGSSAAMWGETNYVPPTPTRVSTGIYRLTYPTQVSDALPLGAPGYYGPHTLNFRAGWANISAGGVPFVVSVAPSSGNVLTITIYGLSGSLVDPAASTFDIYGV